MFYIAEKIKPRGTNNQTMCSFTIVFYYLNFTKFIFVFKFDIIFENSSSV